MQRLSVIETVPDIHLLPQRADVTDLVMPSKLTGMLASGRPVVATAHEGTEVARVVEGRGLVVPAGAAACLCRGDQRAADKIKRRKGKQWSKRELERQFKTALFERMVLSPVKVSPLVSQIHPGTLGHPSGSGAAGCPRGDSQSGCVFRKLMIFS